jgi:hypothetical protein
LRRFSGLCLREQSNRDRVETVRDRLIHLELLLQLERRVALARRVEESELVVALCAEILLRVGERLLRCRCFFGGLRRSLRRFVLFFQPRDIVVEQFVRRVDRGGCRAVVLPSELASEVAVRFEVGLDRCRALGFCLGDGRIEVADGADLVLNVTRTRLERLAQLLLGVATLLRRLSAAEQPARQSSESADQRAIGAER